MSEIPQPLPPEEAIKNDPRFSRILEINPEFAGALSTVVSEKNSKDYREYSEFWTGYLSQYNELVDAVTEEIGDDGRAALEDFERKRLSLMSKLMVLTHEPKIFKSKNGKRLTKTITRLSEEKGDILDWEGLYSDILVEVAEMLPRN